MKTYTIGIIGATGYAGVELVRLLSAHPACGKLVLSSVSFEGQNISDVYPSLRGMVEEVLENDSRVIAESDVVFASLPHGHAEAYARQCVQKDALFIDLGADFRLENEEDYCAWYGLNYADAALHKKAVYALPELFREAIIGAKIIANPGCYPTSIALGLAPALLARAIDTEGLVCDSKSGVTGAGRGLSQNTHFPDCNEAFGPYKVAEHRHTPEIEQTLAALAGHPLRVTFVPHLLPLNRGIFSNMYARLAVDLSQSDLHSIYEQAYEKEPFVRVMPLGEMANLKNVRLSNFCDISVHVDERAHCAVIIATLDNMVKGAAGQAIQNMNLCLGMEETTGLLAVPPAF